jgi:hypothetical protein
MSLALAPMMTTFLMCSQLYKNRWYTDCITARKTANFNALLVLFGDHIKTHENLSVRAIVDDIDRRVQKFLNPDPEKEI